MKKAFFPGMAAIGRMRPKDGARTVSSRATEQQSWEGLISFNGGAGESTIFATEEPLQQKDETAPEPVEQVHSPFAMSEPTVAPKKDYYPNVDYYGSAEKG